MPSLARGNPARWWKSRSCGGASRAPRGLFIGPVRRWVARFALAFLLLFIGGVWYITNPQRISRLSEVLLSRVLGGNVKIQSGHLSYSGTLILTGIEVTTVNPEGTPAGSVPIFTAEQIEARFDWFSLLSGQLTATQLVATTPVFQAIEDRDSGHWNYERLRPGFGGSSSTPSTGKGLSLPVVILRDAHVKWGEVRQGKLLQTTETVIDGEMTPDALLASTYHFQFAQFAPATSTAGTGPAGALIRGTWDSAENTFSVTSDNVVMTDSLRDSLPRVARDWCAEHQLAGRLAKLNLAFTPREGLMLTVSFDDVSMIWMIAPEPGIVLGEDRPAYPLDINNVRGQVVFSLNQNVMHVVDLRGTILGYDFIANSNIQGFARDASNPNAVNDRLPYTFDLDLRFPNANVSDRYPPLFLAFGTSQDLMQRMEPHGRMDIAVQARRTAPRGPVTFEGQIDLHDARLRYAHFPAPMDHVNGNISFDNQSVTFHDVTGKSDLIDARISGTCGTVWSNRLVDMTISSPNVLLDDRLAACLPAQFQDIWNLFSLNGRGSFVCRVTRGTSLFDQQKLTLDLDIADAQGYLRAVPYPFVHGNGRLHLDDVNARIEHFTAQTGADGSGRITLDGVVRHSGDDVTHLQPELHLLADVPVDALLMHALPEDFTSQLAAFTLGGRMGYDGAVRRVGDPGAETVQVAGNLSWKQGTLQTHYGAQPLSFSGISAQAVISPTAVDLKSFFGSVDAGDQKLQMQLGGKIDIATFSGLIHASLSGKDLPLPAAAPALFAEDWRNTWASFAPVGVVDLSAEGNLRINLPANPASAQPAFRVSDNLAIDSYTARLTLHDVSLKESLWPERMTRVNGKIEIVPGTVSMIGMTGAMSNVTLAWTGQTDPATGKMSLSGDAASKGLPTQWLNHLPEALVSNLDLKRPDITLTLHLDSLTRSASDKPWELQGKLLTTNLASVGALPMIFEGADFAGKGVYTPAADRPPRHKPLAWLAFAPPPRDAGTFDFTGSLSASHVTVNERRIDNLTAFITAASDRHDISISQINGQVAGGTLQGNIHIRTSGPLATSQPTSQPALPETLPSLPPSLDGGFSADLVLNDAELSHLALSEKATDEERKTIGTGRVTASLSLQETFGPNHDRTGRGDLIVRDGILYNVPLSMGLMQVATLRLPVASSFDQASSSYFLRNDQITFERILLESPGINLAGVGTVSLTSHVMDMSFITQTPHEVSIPILTPMLGGLRNEILELSVTGTIDSPKITPVPLSAISNLLRALLPHPSADARHK